MLTAKQQAIIDLREKGLSSKQVAARLGISRATEKFCAWQARHKIAAGDPLDPKPLYCVFRFAAYIGVLPLRLLPDWADKVWAAREHFPWLAHLDRRPVVEVLLGGVVQLTLKQATAARKALAGKRKAGVYKIDRDGAVTGYANEKACGPGTDTFRRQGHGRGCYWL